MKTRTVISLILCLFIPQAALATSLTLKIENQTAYSLSVPRNKCPDSLTSQGVSFNPPPPIASNGKTEATFPKPRCAIGLFAQSQLISVGYNGSSQLMITGCKPYSYGLFTCQYDPLLQVLMIKGGGS